MALGVNCNGALRACSMSRSLCFVALAVLAAVLVGACRRHKGPWAAAASGSLQSGAWGGAAATIRDWPLLAYGPDYPRQFAHRVMLAILHRRVLSFFGRVLIPASECIEAINPRVQRTISARWVAGAEIVMARRRAFGGRGAWIIGKTSPWLGAKRYLAIATLASPRSSYAVMKNEDWLARGVKERDLVCPACAAGS